MSRDFVVVWLFIHLLQDLPQLEFQPQLNVRLKYKATVVLLTSRYNTTFHICEQETCLAFLNLLVVKGFL